MVSVFVRFFSKELKAMVLSRVRDLRMMPLFA